MNLIILTNSDSITDNRYKISDHRATHIRRILKSKPGDTITAGLLNGPTGQALIETVTPDEITLSCQWSEKSPPPSPTIDLICAMPRPQTLKKVLHSAAAMAVQNIYLIRANRTEKTYFDSTLVKEQNYLPYLLEGLSQGKQTRLPKVSVHIRFKPFFEDTLPQLEKKAASASDRIEPKQSPSSLSFRPKGRMARSGEISSTPVGSNRSPNTQTPNTIKLLPDLDTEQKLTDLNITDAKNILLAIGPEGGWVPFETDLMKTAGFIPYNLGPWTLRVENALVAAISQVSLITKK